MRLTRQQLFDAALFGIRKQEYRPAMRVDSTGSKSCVYLADNGDRCAIGHALPPDTPDYVLGFDGSIRRLYGGYDFVRDLIAEEDLELARDLQNLHDTALRKLGAKEWEYEMQGLGIVHSVVYTPKEAQ